MIRAAVNYDLSICQKCFNYNSCFKSPDNCAVYLAALGIGTGEKFCKVKDCRHHLVKGFCPNSDCYYHTHEQREDDESLNPWRYHN